MQPCSTKEKNNKKHCLSIVQLFDNLIYSLLRIPWMQYLLLLSSSSRLYSVLSAVRWKGIIMEHGLGLIIRSIKRWKRRCDVVSFSFLFSSEEGNNIKSIFFVHFSIVCFSVENWIKVNWVTPLAFALLWYFML